jgi:hypothetical protein
MQSNIYEHSYSSRTGIVAFKATAAGFEFVVCGRGIGVLQSLRTVLTTLTSPITGRR